MRPWLVSALVVGGIVAAVLAFKDGDGQDGAGAPPRPGLRPPLTAREVDDYIEIWPKLAPVFTQAGEIYKEEMSRTGVMPEGDEMQARVMATLSTVLKPHRYTLQTWRELQIRVEGVVDAVREEEAGARYLAELEKEIETKRGLLALNPDDEGYRRTVEADIRALEEDRESVEAGPPLRDADRELVKAHWKKLDEIAPKKRSGVSRSLR